jgi:hypothetical protein
LHTTDAPLAMHTSPLATTTQNQTKQDFQKNYKHLPSQKQQQENNFFKNQNKTCF